MKGTFIYTGDSSVSWRAEVILNSFSTQVFQICRAAIHSGATTQDGGESLVVVAHPQKHYTRLESHGILSEAGGPYPAACK